MQFIPLDQFYLVLQKIENTFGCHLLNETKNLDAFVQYLYVTWLNWDALYPPRFWNNFGVSAGRRRISNVAESFHSKLSKNFTISPTFFPLLDKLQSEAEYEYFEIKKLEANNSGKRQHYDRVTKDEEFANLFHDYSSNSISIDDFFHSIHNLHFKLHPYKPILPTLTVVSQLPLPT